jgi:hypothetical protein
LRVSDGENTKNSIEKRRRQGNKCKRALSLR